MRELVNEVDNGIGKDTICGFFRTMHERKWLQRFRSKIQPQYAVQRLAWANYYANFTSDK
jgi:hypothetical protein